jgi:hypothetical protein
MKNNYIKMFIRWSWLTWTEVMRRLPFSLNMCCWNILVVDLYTSIGMVSVLQIRRTKNVNLLILVMYILNVVEEI